MANGNRWWREAGTEMERKTKGVFSAFSDYGLDAHANAKFKSGLEVVAEAIKIWE